VDLAQVFVTPPRSPAADRLSPAEFSKLRARLAAAGLHFLEGGAVEARLLELRRMYEPYVNSLADYLQVSIPPWMPALQAKDNWQTSAWEKSSAPEAPQPAGIAADEHF